MPPPDLSQARPDQAPLTGMALRSCAVVCFAAMGAGIKLATLHGVGLAELIFWRNVFSFPVILGWVLLGPGLASLRTPRIRAHATRSVVGLFSMFLNFYAITLLPLAEATTIGFSTPLFATALSPLLLREAVGRDRWLAVGVGFAGVLIVLQPGGHAIPVRSLAAGIVAAAGVAFVHVTLRQIGATERATTTVFWFNAASLVATAALMPFVMRAHDGWAWPWLALVGVAGGAAQILMTASLRFATVPTLAPFDYGQLVWATLLGWLLFASVPLPATLLGGALIAASGIVIALRERRRHVRAATTPAEPEL